MALPTLPLCWVFVKQLTLLLGGPWCIGARWATDSCTIAKISGVRLVNLHQSNVLGSDGSPAGLFQASIPDCDQATWDKLVRQYAPLVARWGRRQGIAGVDLETIVQQVFSVAAANAADQCEDSRSLQSLLADLTGRLIMSSQLGSGTCSTRADSDISADDFSAVCAALDVLEDLLPASSGSTDQTAEIELVGRVIDGYEILSVLGSGGMGTVYRAHQARLGRDVAVKVIHHGSVPTPRLVARFQREMLAIGQVNHGNIVRALDANRVDGVHYLAMELVDGRTVRQLLAGGQRLDVGTACEIARQIAAGLQHAHEAGLIHRDVKPSNLIVTSGDRGSATAKILDLGLARCNNRSGDSAESTIGRIVGTVQYMAPEQARGDAEIDARVDVYGLGVTLFQMLTGRFPYDFDTKSDPMSVLTEIAVAEPKPIEQTAVMIPPQLAAAVDNAITKDRDKRTASCRDFAAQLEPFAKPFTYPLDAAAQQRVLPSANATKDRQRDTGQLRPVKSRLLPLLSICALLAVAVVSSYQGRTRIASQPRHGMASTESGTEPLTEPLTEPTRAESVRVVAGMPRVAADDSGVKHGYRRESYHPSAPEDRSIEVDFRGHQSDPETLNLFFEAPPGMYQLRLRPDAKGLLETNTVDLYFYHNGDSAKYDPERRHVVSQPHAVVRTPAPAVATLEVQPGTQKFSVCPAWRPAIRADKKGMIRVPRTHTVCTFYSYPDLTYANATVTPRRLYAGDAIELSFDVLRCIKLWDRAIESWHRYPAA